MGIAIEMGGVAFERKSSTRRVVVLKDLSLQVAEGEALGLMGKSGCGKSTLINLMAGYLHPQVGDIYESGRRVTGPSPARIVVFQEDALWPWLTVEGNIRLGQAEAKTEGPFSANDLMLRLGVDDARTAYPAELSGGMAKRVELARAIAAQPKVLMLDEALRSVDVATKQICIDLLQEFRARTGAAVISVSHDVEEVVRMVDRIVVLSGEPASIDQSFDVSAEPGGLNPTTKARLLQALGYRL